MGMDMINEIGHLSTCCEAEIVMGCGDMGKCKDCGENTTSIEFEANFKKLKNKSDGTRNEG